MINRLFVCFEFWITLILKWKISRNLLSDIKYLRWERWEHWKHFRQFLIIADSDQTYAEDWAQANTSEHNWTQLNTTGKLKN